MELAPQMEPIQLEEKSGTGSTPGITASLNHGVARNSDEKGVRSTLSVSQPAASHIAHSGSARAAVAAVTVTGH